MTRRAIFITGAGQGIGAATAERFAREGWFVGVYDVNAAAVEALAARLGADRTHAMALDVTDPAQWQRALEAFWSAAGERCDVLLNNAGIAASGRFEALPLATHHRIADVNFKGVLTGCHAGFPYLSRTPGATLINLASASAIYGAAELASYSATKFAVRGLTEALDLEWRRHGIRVCDVWPIFVQTKMVDALDIGSLRSLGVSLQPADVADAIWRCATHRGWRRVHWLVGAQTRGMYWATCFLPDWLHRWATARVSGQ